MTMVMRYVMDHGSCSSSRCKVLDLQDLGPGCIINLVQVLAQSIFQSFFDSKFHLNPVLYVHVSTDFGCSHQGEQPCKLGTDCGLGGWCCSGPAHRAGKGEKNV